MRTLDDTAIPNVWLSETEQALTSCLENFQQRAAAMWEGKEKEAVIALTRILDCITVSGYWGKSGEYLPPDTPELNRSILTMGYAPALRPFLSVTRNLDGGVPYGPAHPEEIRFAYSYLNICGSLTFLRRMASLQRYGLATTEQVGSSHFRITVSPGAPEEAARYSRRLLDQDDRPSFSARKRRHWNKLHARMKRYVQPTDGWFIRYDNDWEIIEAYREKARLYGKGYLEAEALPDDVIIGDRSFGTWKESCNQAVGRILAHMDFAAFLQRKKPSITMDNVLTIFIRREDAEEVWIEAGLPADQVDATMRALTLEFDDLDEWERAFEPPSVFYVSLGKDFLLLPCFGALMNPFYAMFRHLRESYRADWDRAVDLREAIFRADLATAFPRSRFIIPGHGYKLRRPDGSIITDIDALILDRETGDLALVQLKWHDVFGFSLSERESRRRNIARANEWVERVSTWISNQSSQEVISALGIKANASQRPPILYVLARYSARFSGNHVHDERASWMGWPEVLTASRQSLPGAHSPLLEIPDWIATCQKQFEQPGTESRDFHFPGLTITIDLPVTTETIQQPRQ